MAELLEAARKQREDEIPDGWLSAEDVAEQEGRPKSSARDILRQLLGIAETGVLEMKTFRKIGRNGRIYDVPHFRFPDGEETP